MRPDPAPKATSARPRADARAVPSRPLPDRRADAPATPRRGTRPGLLVALALGLAAIAGASGPAGAAPATVAVFPFELGEAGPGVDATGDPAAAAMALMNGGASAEDKRRLGLVTDEMRRLLAPGYGIVDLGSQAAAIDTASPLNRCNGCEADLAKAAGADLSVLGRVQKLTPVLIHVDITVRDTASGDVVRAVSVDVNGDTDDMWLRAVRWLTKNRLSDPPLR